jgi:hypothetical protein
MRKLCSRPGTQGGALPLLWQFLEVLGALGASSTLLNLILRELAQSPLGVLQTAIYLSYYSTLSPLFVCTCQ